MIDKAVIIGKLFEIVGGMLYKALKDSKLDPAKRVIEVLGPYDESKSEKAKMLLEDLKFIVEMEKRYSE